MARRLLKNDEKPTPTQMKEQAIAKHPTLDFNNADFKTMSGKVTVTCTVHNTQHTNFTYSAHVKRADGHRTPCKQCAILARANKRRIDPTEYLRLCAAKHNNRYVYHPDTYSGVDKLMTIKCRQHGDFRQQANVHLSGHGCKKCMAEDASARLRSNTGEFIDAAHALDMHKITEDNEEHYNGVIGEHKYDYSLVEYGKNGRDNVKIICTKSKKHMRHIFYQNPENHLAGKGCMLCHASKGEREIADILIDNDIEYIHEAGFDNEAVAGLRYDFYLPEFNTCIEYHGEFHYKSCEWGRHGGVEGLQQYNRRDEIKAKYCGDNGIKLYIIKYDENIAERVDDLFDELNE